MTRFHARAGSYLCAQSPLLDAVRLFRSHAAALGGSIRNFTSANQPRSALTQSCPDKVARARLCLCAQSPLPDAMRLFRSHAAALVGSIRNFTSAIQPRLHLDSAVLSVCGMKSDYDFLTSCKIVSLSGLRLI